MKCKKGVMRALSVVNSVLILCTSLQVPQSQIQAQAGMNQGLDGYQNFTSDKTIAELNFGTDVTASTKFNKNVGYGFSDVNFNVTPWGWKDGIYYSRAEYRTESSSSYVSNVNGGKCLAIRSKVWTETDSTGYGVFTYENTSTFDMDVYNADYNVEVVFSNPTATAYTAYVEAENVTKNTNIQVPAWGTKTVNFEANVIDGMLNLKFLAPSTATSINTAEKTVYVEKLKVTRKATNKAGNKPTIFIASDSTVQTYDKYYYPQTGWGQVLAQYFGSTVSESACSNCGYGQSRKYETEKVIVENRAIGGRSSKSFIDEGKFDDLIEDVKPGDYVLVQWGHNDATKVRPNRYVQPNDFENLMGYYVDAVIQRGATPILVTPVARYSYSTNSNGSLKTFVSNFEEYRKRTLSVANKKNVPVIDLTQRSIDECNKAGIQGAKGYFLHVSAGQYPNGAYKNGATDSTHLQYNGAVKFAGCIAQGILEYNTTNALDGLKKLVNGGSSQTGDDKKENYLFDFNYNNSPTQAGWIGINHDQYYTKSLGYGWTTIPNNGRDRATSVGTTPNMARDFSIGVGDFVLDLPNGSYEVTIYGGDTMSGTMTTVEYTVEGKEFGKIETSQALDKITKIVKVTDGQLNVSVGGKNPYISGLAVVKIEEQVVEDVQLDYGKTYSFDMNYNNSPTQAGWIGINHDQYYTKSLGYGWITIPNNGRDRATNVGTTPDMARDFTIGNGVFAFDVSNGDYEITIYGGDTMNGTRTAASYKVEGVDVGSIESNQTLELITKVVTVKDGQLNVEVGGKNPYLSGLEIKELKQKELNTPTGVVATEISVNGSKLSFLLSFNVDNSAEGYKIYQRRTGESQFKLVKSFTTAQYNADELACKSMSLDTGYEYEFYVTGYRGTNETKPSDILRVDATNGQSSTETKETNPTEVIVETKESVAPVEETIAPIVVNSGDGREHYSDRAVVAINLAGDTGAETLVGATDKNGNKITKGIYLSWRSFKDEYGTNNKLKTSFTVYRNGQVIASNLKYTNLVDEAGKATDVYKVVGNNDTALKVHAKDTKCWDKQYLELRLFCPDSQKMPDGSRCDYTANDMSVADLDGDGELELIVKWYPSNAKDNAHSGYTGTTFLDGYDVDYATGNVKLLWRIDLGINIRSGAHYTQFQVWDYNCDGKAEIAMKTADATTTHASSDGTASGLHETGHVGACSSLPSHRISTANDYRNSSGYILSGPEYFTMFNGTDGTIIDSVSYVPARGNVNSWGDGYGNRVDRFLSATAYLNGSTPSAVFARGYYARTSVTAYSLKSVGGNRYKIITDWTFDSTTAGKQYEAQGNHGISINDVDFDGKDEIIYGSFCIDHNGVAKYNTGLGHGDAMHVSDWVPSNPGLEVFKVGEHSDAKYQVEIFDANTGKILAGYKTGKDTGRGVAADIDPTAIGAEFWASYGANGTAQVYSSLSKEGNLITLSGNSTPSSNFTLFWDGDLLKELQDHNFNASAYAPVGTNIQKWNYETNSLDTLLYSTKIHTSNGSKGNVGLVADILGDWREEVIARSATDSNVVRIYATTIQTDYVVPCLLEDLAYREGVAWQNVSYNQPANLSYLLSDGVETARLKLEKTSATTATINFSAACDGKYGHAVEGYRIYRSKNNKDYELVKTVLLNELEYASSQSFIDELGKTTATIYKFKDRGLEKNTEYSYKIAAYVNGRDSYMSKALKAKTGNTETEDDFGESEYREIKNYKDVSKFDFGIDSYYVESGWTNIVVNPKKGSKTVNTLGIEYSSNKGYGFLDGTVRLQGRKEGFESACEYSSNIYSDFVLPAGQTFVVDVPNGEYEVTLIGGSLYESTIEASVENQSVKVDSEARKAASKVVVVNVSDGQLTIEFATGVVSRLGGIVIREIQTTIIGNKPVEETIVKPSESVVIESKVAPSKETVITPTKESAQVVESKNTNPSINESKAQAVVQTKSVMLNNVEFGKEVSLSNYDYKNIKKIAVKFKGKATAYNGAVVFGSWVAQESYTDHECVNKVYTVDVKNPQPSISVYKWWSDSDLEIDSIELIYSETVVVKEENTTKPTEETKVAESKVVESKEVVIEPTKEQVVVPTKEMIQESKAPATSQGQIADGWYYIKNVHAQKYVHVSDNLGKAGQNVELRTGNGCDGQKWYVKNLNGGYVTFQTALGNFMMDVAYGSADDGANIGIYNGYSGEAQQYILKPTSEKNTYYIMTRASNGEKALDDYANSKAEGANVCQWSFNGNNNQKFVFEKIDDKTVSAESEQAVTETVYNKPLNQIKKGNQATRVSVHDPSIVEANGQFYFFGSHMAAAKSKDLRSFSMFADGVNANNRLFSNLFTGNMGAFAYTGKHTDGNYAVWAPDVIYNKDMRKWVMYFCTSHDWRTSAICMATSNNIEGPYTYEKTLLYSGFNASTVGKTNFREIMGNTNVNNYLKNGQYNHHDYPNCIDPTVFYDKDGKLWMTYGSWSGGIFMLELNRFTGLPIHPNPGNGVDKYFGYHLIGGLHKSCEGPYIMYDETSDFYYLFVSYGELTRAGGYQIRQFRSKNVTGPYTDTQGASLGKVSNHSGYGLKMIGNYSLPSLNTAYMAPGHNSAIKASNGKYFLVYHQRMDNNTEYHEIRVHQMYLNEDNWFVAAPFSYAGETIATKWTMNPGKWCGKLYGVNHGTDINGTIHQYKEWQFETDGRVRTPDGTWGTYSIKNNTNYITMNVGNDIYRGVIGQMKDEAGNDVVFISAVDRRNQTVWIVKYL